jgi:hypothetical protein
MKSEQLNIAWRDEMANIPEGCSITKTSRAYYIRIRILDVIYSIRCPHDFFETGDITRVEAFKEIND